MPDNDVVAMLRAFLTAADAYVFVYCGDITTSGYDEISRLCREEKRKERALLVLSTVGGDANAGYRIARALTHPAEHGDAAAEVAGRWFLDRGVRSAHFGVHRSPPYRIP
jgi:hypothetical protein